MIFKSKKLAPEKIFRTVFVPEKMEIQMEYIIP